MKCYVVIVLSGRMGIKQKAIICFFIASRKLRKQTWSPNSESFHSVMTDGMFMVMVGHPGRCASVSPARVDIGHDRIFHHILIVVQTLCRYRCHINFHTSVFGLQWRLLTWGLWIDFEGPVNLNGEKIINLFSLTYNRNLALHSVLNVGNKVTYGLQTPQFYWLQKISLSLL